MNMEQCVDWVLAGETQAHAENLLQCHFSTMNATWPALGSNTGCLDMKPVTNHLSNGTAIHQLKKQQDLKMQDMFDSYIRLTLTSGKWRHSGTFFSIKSYYLEQINIFLIWNTISDLLASYVSFWESFSLAFSPSVAALCITPAGSLLIDDACEWG
jgi:hypothetical protein